ncbi:tetratricopeptide repeat protein [Hamadaea tsunoensis]|uniref:tetratricopeptide repeat protein n=1 Tax=Hamadaea tsunoensis TaxID=53368 RepID=UPI0004279F58|nr:tetratricopeptide repeat protein [Hamadaea tsunoensis]
MQEDPLATAQQHASTGDHGTAIALARGREAELLGVPADDLESAVTLLWVRLHLARWLAIQRKPDRWAALGVLDAALQTWRSDVVQRSEMVHLLGAELMSLRSFVLRQLGRAADSLAASSAALTYFGELDQVAPGMLSKAGRVPILLNEGAALADLGRTAESLVPLTDALDLVRAGGGPRDVETELLVLRSTSLTLLGRFDEAADDDAQAIAIARTGSGRATRNLLVAALSNHATTLTRQRRLDEALSAVDEALRVLEEAGENDRRRWGIPLTTRAEILLAQGRRAEAAGSARLAEPIMREYAQEVPLLVASSLANVFLLIGDAEDDLAYAREALARFTALKEEFSGRYDYWWRRSTEVVDRLSPRQDKDH